MKSMTPRSHVAVQHGHLPVAGLLSQGACLLRLHHLLHSARRHPAAGSGRLQGCGERGGSPAPTTPSVALYWPPFGSRLRPVAGLRRGEARWLRRHHLLHSFGRRPAAGSGRLQGCSARGNYTFFLKYFLENAIFLDNIKF
jgi:hypothetical protein